MKYVRLFCNGFFSFLFTFHLILFPSSCSAQPQPAKLQVKVTAGSISNIYDVPAEIFVELGSVFTVEALVPAPCLPVHFVVFFV